MFDERYIPDEIKKWKSKDAAYLASIGKINEAETLIARPAALSDMEKLLDTQEMPPEVDMLPTGSYPPTNIIRTYNGYRIEIAVAGFFESDLSVVVEDNSILLVRSDPKLPEQEIDYVTQGIAKRRFLRSFQLGKDVNVIDSILNDGILTVNLTRHIPEPTVKTIPINKKPKFLAEVKKNVYSPAFTDPVVKGVTGVAIGDYWLQPQNTNDALAAGVDITVQHK